MACDDGSVARRGGPVDDVRPDSASSSLSQRTRPAVEAGSAWLAERRRGTRMLVVAAVSALLWAVILGGLFSVLT